MVRKRIPLVTHGDPAYAASLPRHEALPGLPAPFADPEVPDRNEYAPAPSPLLRGLDAPYTVRGENPSTQIDVRVTALARQEAELLACGIEPRHVIRAALRKAVKQWQFVPQYVAPAAEKHARHKGWTIRTSVAISTAAFDRLLAAHDPLGVCSRWSLVKGQLEPVVWTEIDALLASFREDLA